MLPVVLIIMRDMQRVLHASLFHVPATSASLTVLLASVVIAPHRHRWAAAATAIAISLLCDAVGHTWGRVYRPHTTAVGLLLTTALLPAVPAPNDTKGQQKVPSPALPRCMPPVLATATISPPGTPAGSPRSSVASGGARGSSGASSLRAFQQQLAALQAPSRADVQLHWRVGALAGQRASLVCSHEHQQRKTLFLDHVHAQCPVFVGGSRWSTAAGDWA